MYEREVPAGLEVALRGGIRSGDEDDGFRHATLESMRPLPVLLVLAGLLTGCGEPAVTVDGLLRCRLDSLHLPASGTDTALAIAGSETGENWSECHDCTAGYSGGFVPWLLGRNGRSFWRWPVQVVLRIDSIFPLAADPRRGLIHATLESPRGRHLVGEIRASMPMDRMMPLHEPILDTLTFRDTSGLYLQVIDSSVLESRGASRQELLMAF